MSFDPFLRRAAMAIAATGALAACGLLAGCGSGAPDGEVLAVPTNVLEDAKNSDAAYDQEAQDSKRGKRRSAAEADRQIPSF